MEKQNNVFGSRSVKLKFLLSDFKKCAYCIAIHKIVLVLHVYTYGPLKINGSKSAQITQFTITAQALHSPEVYFRNFKLLVTGKKERNKFPRLFCNILFSINGTVSSSSTK